MSNDIIKVTDASFEVDVLQSSTPVLVDFWAEWCGPCRMLSPILEETAKEMNGRIIVAKMNVDENEEIPAKLSIRGIPALFLFKNGVCVDTKVGMLSKNQLIAFLETNLG
jgi:thioredoxin 1